MFNNPFGSFHDTVAEAKQEREQLDRLLTISTPRERQLVAVIAVLLLVLAAWFFFGSVGLNVSVDGVLVEPGENLPEGNRSVRALIWVESDVAPRLMVGMPAAVQFGEPSGEADFLDGEIATIFSVPMSEDVAPFESTAPVSAQRVDIMLHSSENFAPLVGRKCQIVIEIGRDSPVNILRMKRS